MGGPVHSRSGPIAHPAASLLSAALPDRSAGNRPTILALVHQSVEDITHSRRTNRPASVPCCLRPPGERLPSPATGLLLDPSTQNPPEAPVSILVRSRSRALPTRFGGFGLTCTGTSGYPVESSPSAISANRHLSATTTAGTPQSLTTCPIISATSTVCPPVCRSSSFWAIWLYRLSQRHPLHP